MRSPLNNPTEPGLSLSNENICRSIVEHTTAILLTLVDGTIVDANAAAESLLGYSKAELQNIQEIFGPAFLEVFKQSLAGGRSLFDCHAIHKNGSLVPCEVSAVVLKNVHEQDLIGVSMYDASKRLELQNERLKNAEDRARVLIERVSDSFVSLDRNFRFTYVNKKAAELGERTVESLLGRSIWEEFPDIVGSHIYHAYHKAMIEQQYVHTEYYHEPSKIWLEYHIYPSPDGVSAFIQDITEKKQVQSELMKAHTQLLSAQQIVKLGYWEIDLEGNPNYWSNQTYEICGLKKGDTDPTIDDFLNLLHPEDKDEFSKNYCEALQGTPSLRADYRLVTKDGEVRHILLEAARVCNEEGKPVKLQGTIQDITKLKKNELALTELNAELNKRAEELAKSNSDLEQFAYVASHDLQEPLRMVTSFLTQIEKKYHDLLDDKGRQYIHFAVDGAVRMKRIISDLLEYSRVGKSDTEKQRIDVNALVEEIVQLNHTAIEEKNAEVLWENLPVVHYSKVPLQQVMHNLLSNALKYQKSGHRPRIEIKALETPTDWQFSLSDNGIGIDPKHFEKIFGLFKRLHGKGEYSGTGLGLAICKKIVETYKGQIWVDSVPGIGSTFYFTIPKDLSNFNSIER